MIIAVTAQKPSLNAAIDSRFGRCAYFVIIDTDKTEYETMSNTSMSTGGGAGIQTAQRLAKKGVHVVLTGNCGPNAYKTLAAAGIDVVVGQSGIVAEVVKQFQSGELKATNSPNVASHSGMEEIPR
jgi:predicted Fe-Mo cluster-binding NifX family protein